MSSLIRDVLFPSAAALGLLVAAAVDTATAEEAGPARTAVVTAAPVVVAAVRAETAVSVAPVAAANAAPRADVGADESERSNGIERRCDRTGRIGKFRITRCD